MGMPQKRLQQDCPTHWNSTYYMAYYMAKTLLENKRPVVAVCLMSVSQSDNTGMLLDMSSEKWASFEELVKVLEPLEVATVFF